jgi:hypothetical protein
VAFCLTAPAAADYYDNFNDGWFERDSNDTRYDANDPYWTYPNNIVEVDIDNPDWAIKPIVGATFFAEAINGALRLFADEPLIPYAFIAAGPDSSEENWSDDSQDHYILARAQFFDPNRGEVVVMTHTDEFHWTAFGVGYSEGNWSYIFSANGTDFNNGETEHRTDLDMVGGFWMVFQFDVVDPNFDPGDPNGKYVRAALWNGGKFDWDGVWDLQNPAGYDYLDRGYYWTAGPSLVGTYGNEAGGGIAIPADSKFDFIEVRTGTFTNVSHTLLVKKIKSEDYGTVMIDPDLLGAGPDRRSTNCAATQTAPRLPWSPRPRRTGDGRSGRSGMIPTTTPTQTT